MHTWLPREMKLLIATIILLYGITTTQAAFVSTPTSVNATLGSTATFNCSVTTGTIDWLVNGSPLSELRTSYIKVSSNERTSFLKVPATVEYNNTVVVCEVTIVDTILRSDSAVLTVQDLLAAVENLTVHSQWPSILLTWTPPFSLDITGVDPDLWYCVEVYNISLGRAPLSTNCSVYEPQFYFTTPNYSRCDLFEFRVFAVNQVGNGTLTSANGTFHTKPAPGAVSMQIEFISTVKIKVKLLFLRSVDICNGQVFATNMSGSTSLGGVEGTGISNLVIYVTDCTLQFNRNYTMTMKVGEGDRSVLMLGDLSTFDIKTVLVNNNSSGAVNVICTFATNSQALGCLVVLHPWNTTQTEIFVYAARDNRHVPTANITIHGVPRGNYTVLVFDGEYNGLLSERAAFTPQNITVTDGSLKALGENSGSSASINTTGDQICVSCPDDGVSKGCIVVLRPPQELQSTMNYEIPNLVEEKCFHQERSGEYTVAVFKKTTNKTLNGIPLNVSVVSVSSLTPITRVTPTTHSTTTTLEITAAVTSIIAFVVGALAGVSVYHCISKHRSRLKTVLSSHQRQQADLEYDYVTSGVGNKLSRIVAYDTVQRIELKANVAYKPAEH